MKKTSDDEKWTCLGVVIVLDPSLGIALDLGLANGLPASTLVGLPFLDATQSIIDLANKFICCNVFDEVWPFTLKEITVNKPNNFAHASASNPVLSMTLITAVSGLNQL
jgi:hypothetical protein